VQSGCAKVETVWFLQWAAPFLAVACNAMASVFCAIFAKTYPGMSKDDQISRVQQLLKKFVLAITFTIATMYCSITVSGASVSLGSAMLCLGAAASAAMMGYMYLEVDHSVLKSMLSGTSLGNNLVKITKSDWSRAVAVGALNILIPAMALLDMARQSLRRIRGRAGSPPSQDRFTPRGRKVVEELKSWNWCSIFGKVNILAEVWFLIIVGSKFTFVFFSWLNVVLGKANLGFWPVTAMVFVIGLAMFMCPAVPGSAVYLFAGVVLGAQAQLSGSIGFWPGVIVACVTSAIAKHVACTLQYGLGYAAGKSVRVQKFVGVDKVPTRAMEQILKSPGFNIGKVCILIAGPDFPTSMLCGILKLSIPQMLLGTSPVILVSIIPQVLVGALLTMSGGDSGTWSMISTSVTGCAAAFQAGATLIFSYRIMKTVEQDGDTLAQPRKEHEAVAELTKADAAYTEKFKEVSKWSNMTCGQQTLVLLTSCIFLAAGFITAADYMLSEKFCFRKFSITDQISAPYELGGLDGSALNLIIAPAGWGALGLALVATIMHVLSGKWLAYVVRKRMNQVEKVPPTPASVVGKVDEEVPAEQAAN